MTVERPELDSRAAIEALTVQLAHAGRHIQPVRWQLQPAWLKLSVPQPPAWRYTLLAAMARLIGLPAIQPVRPTGGSQGIHNEKTRLETLAAAGVRVPAVLAHAGDWLLTAEVGTTTLESLIRNAEGDARLDHWQRGADYIRQVHAAGQYLSQAFARNLVWSAEVGLSAIDFEDDPGSAMSLTDAQIRDWLPYLFSTAIHFEDRLPTLCDRLHGILGSEDSAVATGTCRALRRTAWLRHLRHLPARLQRRDVRKTQCFGAFAHLCATRPRPAHGDRATTP